jgi:glycerophosphoryl diester phosphodiesterase
MRIDASRFVAHRGYAHKYPENTLLAMSKAVEAGALFLECDIQLTADGTPVVHHDPDILRTTGKKGTIMDMRFAELSRFSFGEPAKFGNMFSRTPPTALTDLVKLISKNRKVSLFVELKEESLDRFGTRFMTEAVFKAVKPVRNRCVAISFAVQPLKIARELGWDKIGWVLPHFGEKYRKEAESLSPDYLFCDHDEIPPLPGSLWKGKWKWALYEIADEQLAEKWFNLGADMAETMRIGEMLGAIGKRGKNA